MQPVDLEPETDGKGWNNLITQGLLIRNMKQGANDYPFQMSFKELFDAMDCRYNLGMRIEKDGDDYFIRVEPKYYFYESEPNDVSFEYVSDIKETVNTDVIYNVFNSGYQKWQMNIAKINGIDEFNSPRTWKCSNKNANKTLDRVCKFIASGYLIEFTRREQFRKVPTTSFETDTEKFFIALNRVTVTSTKYTDDGTSDTYGLGEVSETLEAFDNVSNVLNPSTCYNLRHTPREMAASWMNFLGITKDEWHVAAEAGNGIIFRRYTEFPSNSDLRYILSAVKDNYYVSLSLIFNTKLIGQLNVEFEVNLTFEQFNQITQNSFKRIAYFCSDIDSDGAEGWISSIKFRPNVDGTAQIKLNKNG
jgi:hypothetical protein